jgi:glycosyltransferase involved in cell wall biosynthesis
MQTVPVSVVIICRNAVHTIQKTIHAAQALTDDVVVADSGSTDGTQAVVLVTNARLINMEWMGFGANKNKGNEEARHDWILSLDADEELSDELTTAIKQLDFTHNNTVYAFRRLNYLGRQPVHFGEWRNDWVKRLFHRKLVKWDDAPVHENLIIPPTVQVKKLPGVLHHYTTTTIESYNLKLEKYALLMAEKYYNKGKKARWHHLYVSPSFNFIKHYVVRFGWMDKKAGWKIALAHAKYTLKKYQNLKQLQTSKVIPPVL